VRYRKDTQRKLNKTQTTRSKTRKLNILCSGWDIYKWGKWTESAQYMWPRDS